MGGFDYGFLNELMDKDPQIAAFLRSNGIIRPPGGDVQGGKRWYSLVAPGDDIDEGFSAPERPETPMDRIGDEPPATGPLSSLPPYQPPVPDDELLRAMAPEPPSPKPERVQEIEGPGGILLSNPAGGGGPMQSRFVDPAPHPGVLNSLKKGWPRLLQGAIAAAATPNVAGGGALDIFRAMQAGGDTVEKRNLLDYNIGRQHDIDERDRRKVEADIAEMQARGRYYDAEVERAKAQAATAGRKAEPNSEEQLFQKMMEARAKGDTAAADHFQELWEISKGYHRPKPEAPAKWVVRGGYEYNDRTGEYRPLQDPVKAREQREKEVMELLGVDPLLWPYVKAGKLKDRPDLQTYILNPDRTKQLPLPTPKDKIEDMVEQVTANDPRVKADRSQFPKVYLENMMKYMSPRAGRTPDPYTDLLHQQQLEDRRNKYFQEIEDNKSKELNAAINWEAAEIDRWTRMTGVKPADKQAGIAKARRDAQMKKQMAMDKYAQSIRTATHDPNAAQDYVVGLDGSILPKQPAPAPAPTPPPTSAPPPAPPPTPAPPPAAVAAPAGAAPGYTDVPDGPGMAATPATTNIATKRMPLWKLNDFAKTNNMTPQDARTYLEAQGWVIY